MKKIVTLLLALLLCAALTLPAFADAWIPPTDDGSWNEALVNLPGDGEACKPLNLYFSRFVEANLTTFEADLTGYNAEVSKQEAIRATLKLFELHPGEAPEAVACDTDAAGVTYMRIGAEAFESRAFTLFGETVKAEECPGYRDGNIYVTADNFGAPTKVFAHTVYCDYLGEGEYYAYFDIYALDGVVNDCYALSDPDEIAGVRLIGSGHAQFVYDGGTDTTEFNADDFSVKFFDMTAEGIPYTNENLPYGSDEEPTKSNTPETVVLPTDSARRDEPTTAEAGVSGKLVTILLVAAAVVLIAAAVVVIILVKWRKKP